ncbi:transposase [Marivita sp. S6314]|nr:transposase [Marivita sp. S6314]
MIDVHLTARRDAKAACAFFPQARETVRMYGPVSVTTDKTPTYARVIGEMNAYSFSRDEFVQVDRIWRNNRIESDHAALKRITDPSRGFQSLRTLKAMLQGIEAIRMIKGGHVCDPPTKVTGKVRLLTELFDRAA